MSRTVPLALGIAVGLIAGLGAIGLLLTIRQSILSADEASALVGAPLVGTPTLPARRRSPVKPSQIPGLAALVKRLFPDAMGTAVLISHVRGEELRTILAQMVATTLGRDHSTFLVSSRDEQVGWLYEHLEPGPKVIVTDSLPDPSTWTRLPIIIDGPSARGSDTPQLIPELAQIILVVQQGVPRARVLEVSSQFLPGEITGVLFAKRGSSWPWVAGPRRASNPAARPSSALPAAQASAVPKRPEPQRRRTAGPGSETAPHVRSSGMRQGETRPAAAYGGTTPPKPPEQPSLLGSSVRHSSEIRLDDAGKANGTDPKRGEEPNQASTRTPDDGSLSQHDAPVE